MQPTTQASQTKTMRGRRQPLQNVLFLHHQDVASGFLVCSATVSLQKRWKGERGRIFKKPHPFHPKLSGNSGRDNIFLFCPELNLFFVPPDNEAHTVTLLPSARAVKGCCTLSGPFTKNSWEILLTVQLVVVHTCFLCKSTHYRHARG